ncbi:MAG: very short patch repair endonuclease [Limisphaerales bacterium]
MESSLKNLLPFGKFVGVSRARSQAMSAIRGRNNKSTERRLRALLVAASISGWNLNRRDLFGRPDFFFPRRRVAIFVDGCFWHGCRTCGHIPKTNSIFWKAKIQRNQARDRNTTQTLRQQGIRVLRFWEHDLWDSVACLDRVKAELVRRDVYSTREKEIARLK